MRALALGLVVVLLAGCDLTLQRSPAPSDRTVVPSAGETGPPSAPPEIPFEPTAYPTAGDAPCGQVEAPTGVQPYGGSLRRITSVDRTTVVFELCDPDITFRIKVAAPSLVINDTAWLESRIASGGGEPAITRELNGTGPFRLDRWSGGTEIILSRFDDYRGTDAVPSALVFRWDPDPRRRLDALSSGTVDGIDDLDAAGVTAIEANTELAAQTREGLNVMYLGMNNRFAPFDKVQVRRAIALGLDRQALLDAAFPPGATLATHVTPCSVPNGCAGEAWWERDIPAAKDLLVQAGFPDGFTTKIQYGVEPRDYLPNPEALALELQSQLRDELGVTAELEPMPFADLVAQADEGKLDGIHLLGARARFPDPRVFLDPRLGSGAAPEFGDPDADITAALQAGGTATSDDARNAAYTEANDRIRQRVPLIPIAHLGSVAGYRADVTGFVVSPTHTERFAQVTPGDRAQFAWMQASEPEGLYCPDETAPDALRVCAQLFEGLYRHAPGETAHQPALAETCTPNEESDTWTCTLQPEVRFHDGSRLDANDVVLSYAVQWDAAHPLHRGRTGEFRAFIDRFGGLLNAPANP
jgi:ABC-type transport system substrate-binding protein